MKLSELQTTPGSHKKSKRLGRGNASGKGGTSGKGHKGQMARKGHKRKVNFEGGQMPLLRRLPKRGFKNPTRIAYSAINFDALNQFEDGATVDAGALIALGALKKVEKGGFKVLAKGELTAKNLTVKANAFSATAKAKIEEFGGKCEKTV
ncbi:MAG: 50S ribosomal protein L15 [Kiritimatiellaeota bacterium]|nr:50S ribosomal protein L15 [Kiritimatiellota bacterium]